MKCYSQPPHSNTNNNKVGIKAIIPNNDLKCTITLCSHSYRKRYVFSIVITSWECQNSYLICQLSFKPHNEGVEKIPFKKGSKYAFLNTGSISCIGRQVQYVNYYSRVNNKEWVRTNEILRKTGMPFLKNIWKYLIILL